MPYQTSNRGGLSKVQKIVLVIVILLAFGFFALLLQPKEDKIIVVDDEFLNTYRDPITGEVVTSAEGKTDESYGNRKTPTLLGLKRLIELGFTQKQLNALILSFGIYSEKNDFNPNEISLYPNSVYFEEADQSGFDIDIVRFKIRVARKDDMQATVIRKSSSTITLDIKKDDLEIFKIENVDPDSFERS